MWRSKDNLLDNQWVKEEIKREIKNFLKQIKLNAQHTRDYRMQQKQFRREVYNNKHLHEEKRKISNNLSLHFKKLEEKNNLSPILIVGKK